MGFLLQARDVDLSKAGFLPLVRMKHQGRRILPRECRHVALEIRENIPQRATCRRRHHQTTGRGIVGVGGRNHGHGAAIRAELEITELSGVVDLRVRTSPLSESTIVTFRNIILIVDERPGCDIDRQAATIRAEANVERRTVEFECLRFAVLSSSAVGSVSLPVQRRVAAPATPSSAASPPRRPLASSPLPLSSPALHSWGPWPQTRPACRQGRSCNR